MWVLCSSYETYYNICEGFIPVLSKLHKWNIIFIVKINNRVKKNKPQTLYTFLFQGPHTGVDNNLSTLFFKR